MPRQDRTDVTRRLAALTAPPGAQRAPAPHVGWTPARPGSREGSPEPPGVVPTARTSSAGPISTVTSSAEPGPTSAPGPAAPSSGPLRGDDGDPGVGAPTEPWRPDVGDALALASATRADLVAPTPPRVRWVPTWRAAGAAVTVLALVAGGLALRTVTTARAAPVALPAAAVTGGGPDAGATAADGEQEVVVHVVGAVARPGVVRLPLGARVADAVAAAGGAVPGAELAGVNLARPLTDGEQLAVPAAGEGAPGEPVAVDDGRVDLNAADEADLQELPGVGPVLAGRIVEHRPYTSVDELDDVPGIGPALMGALRERVRV